MTVVTAAQGSESRLLYKKQTQLGVMAPGNYKRARWNTHGIVPNIGSVESNEIRDDRQIEVFRHGNKSVSGPIVQELIYGAHDWLIESGMFSSFDTNGQMGIGKVPQIYSIEDGATDIDKHQMFYDMLVSKLSFDFQPEAMVLLTTDMVGLTPLAPGASQGGTPEASAGGQPFDSFHAAVFDNAEGSGAELATITSLKLEVDNKAAVRYVLGQQTGAAIEKESGMVAGTFQALYDTDLFINRFLSETEFPLVLGVTDLDGQTLTFRMCRVKMATGSAPVVDKKSRIITADFRALYNPDLGYSLRIERYSRNPEETPVDVTKVNHVKDAEEGAWMTVTDPKTGADIVYKAEESGKTVEKPVRILFIGKDSEEFRRLNQAFKAKQVEMLKRNQWNAKTEDDALRDLMSSCARNWEGFTREGKILAFAKSELSALMEKMPALVEQANNFIGDRAPFIKG